MMMIDALRPLPKITTSNQCGRPSHPPNPASANNFPVPRRPYHAHFPFHFPPRTNLRGVLFHCFFIHSFFVLFTSSTVESLDKNPTALPSFPLLDKKKGRIVGAERSKAFCPVLSFRLSTIHAAPTFYRSFIKNQQQLLLDASTQSPIAHNFTPEKNNSK
ncbi:hypothetical protein BGW36DRAFT_106679 [Talaromyces proteolyticus]|uniref:Uncharacterized protein n=1 Tax=Talaromyces proteolyticus TaxID=1131652 RepID=A0AAD4KYG3_9EURO|nr:uncharacterized protein BGW36DRAFT_106679 [Talaromyces proteolyticus]KAH8701852.1 hypothetical protein BGW36DRAFT_106679 [Talaromyces proteolyticus]